MSENNLHISPRAAFVAGAVGGILLLGTIGFVVLALRGRSASIGATGKDTTQPVAQPSLRAPSLAPSGTASVDISNVNIKGQPFIGKANAPTTIAYWYDYQCPFCKRSEEEVLPQVMKEYINTGKVRLVYKDFQFLGPDSQTAGVAGRAVWEVAPDKFSQWHKAMYDKQDNENSGWGSKADILALTTSLGINTAKVEKLMTTKADQYQKAMDADKAEGNTFGVSGTPSFIIGKQLIVGAQPYASLKVAIDEALNNK